jgi:hypothetical protein
MEAGMSSYEGMDTTDAGIDLWRVQLATGEVRAMSLDALDDAFQSGLIAESTPVLPPGATTWTKLADAAGLDAPAAQDAPGSDANVPSIAPLAVSLSESTGDATPYSQTSGLRLPEIDLDAMHDEAFKPKKGRLFAGIGIAVVLVGGLGFAATRVGNVAGSAQSSLSAHAASPPAAAAAAPHVAVDINEAFPAAQLTEEQKARLAEADKAREAREAAKRKDRPSAPARRSTGSHEKSAPFVNGGNKYDPLNGAL